MIAAGAEDDWEPESADAGEDDAAAPEDSGVTNRRQGGTSIGGSTDGELLAGASAARDIVGGRRETELEAEERRMMEAVQRERERERESEERESEERDDEDPEHSSGPDRDLETTSSSISVVVQGLSGRNEHS